MPFVASSTVRGASGVEQESTMHRLQHAVRSYTFEESSSSAFYLCTTTRAYSYLYSHLMFLRVLYAGTQNKKVNLSRAPAALRYVYNWTTACSMLLVFTALKK